MVTFIDIYSTWFVSLITCTLYSCTCTVCLCHFPLSQILMPTHALTANLRDTLENPQKVSTIHT